MAEQPTHFNAPRCEEATTTFIAGQRIQCQLPAGHDGNHHVDHAVVAGSTLRDISWGSS